MDNKQLGRVWLGQTSTASDGITEINLSSTLIGGPDQFFTAGNGFRLRTESGGLSGLSWQNLAQSQTTTVGEGDRNNVIKYVSPTLHGFTFSAAYGEDDMWDVALRYAGEFNGIRIAAGVGYREIKDFNATADGMAGCANLAGTPTELAVDCNSWGGSISVMHVPTGLYVAGAYGQENDDNRKKLFGANVKDDAEAYYIQAGIERKWFSIGKTTLYGEYWHGEFGAGLNAGGVRTLGATDAFNSFGGAARIASSDLDVWGLGIQQSVENAAMDLYLGYKNFSGEARLSATGTEAGSVNARSIEDFQMVIAGAIIRF